MISLRNLLTFRRIINTKGFFESHASDYGLIASLPPLNGQLGEKKMDFQQSINQHSCLMPQSPISCFSLSCGHFVGVGMKIIGCGFV